MKFLLIFAVLFCLSCSSTKTDTELRIRVLEEKFNILDHKIDSLSVKPCLQD